MPDKNFDRLRNLGFDPMQKAHTYNPPSEDLTVRLMYQDAELDCRGPIGDEQLPDAVGEFLARATNDAVLAKGAGTAVPVGTVLPDIAEIVGLVDIEELTVLSKSESEWDVELSPRITLSKAFLERSDRRFERVAEKIHAIFGDHQEEASEAVEAVGALRDSIRHEFVVA